MSDLASMEGVPTSFGVFKPVGWLMVGLPTQPMAEALMRECQAAGWSSDTVLHFVPRESQQELEAMADNATGMAGFGHEITLLRRYIALARQGYRWLLLKVDDTEQATTAAEMARRAGATLAVHYRRLVVEEMI